MPQVVTSGRVRNPGNIETQYAVRLVVEALAPDGSVAWTDESAERVTVPPGGTSPDIALSQTTNIPGGWSIRPSIVLDREFPDPQTGIDMTPGSTIREPVVIDAVLEQV